MRRHAHALTKAVAVLRALRSLRALRDGTVDLPNCYTASDSDVKLKSRAFSNGITHGISASIPATRS